MMAETSSVLPGLMMAKGWPDGRPEGEADALSRSVVMCSSPTMSLKSVHAACNVIGAVSG